MTEITFKDFQRVMLKRKRTIDELTDILRGKIDDPRSFFERAMSCQCRNPETGRNEDRSDTVIPYRSVLQFYTEEAHYAEDSKIKTRNRKNDSSEVA